MDWECCSSRRDGDAKFSPLDDAAKAVEDAGAAVVDGAKKGAGVVVDGTKVGADAVVNGAVATGRVMGEAGTAVVDGAVATGKAVGDLGSELLGNIEATFEKLGAAAGFQAIFQGFGDHIDTSDEGLAKQFAEVDGDKSGKISTEEMRACITKIYGSRIDEKILGEMMAAADTNKDGEVDLDEFKKIMRSPTA